MIYLLIIYKLDVYLFIYYIELYLLIICTNTNVVRAASRIVLPYDYEFMKYED